ncbi:MAG: DUF1385 domain-containing protein [bacterium]|nr:DUF1385 domain-containing protein [bacterium]
MAKSPSSLLKTHRYSFVYRLLSILHFPFFFLRWIEETHELEKTVNQEDKEETPYGYSCVVASDQGDGLGLRRSNAVGGQAVIEGVMMRSKNFVATAVRAPDGRIVCKIQELLNPSSQLFKKPIMRGASMLFETLKLGISTLEWSAKISTAQEDQKPLKWWEKAFQSISLPISLILALSLFLWLPYSIAKWTVGADGNQYLYHLVSNSVQMAILIGYMMLISFSKEVRRVFEYHGAEHKGIMCYEAGDQVIPERMQHHTRFHPRCGTSFLLVLGIVTMLFFSTLDAILLLAGWVYPNALVRVLFHLPLVPIVGGIGYELLKLSDRKKNIAAVAALIQPGLWLQRITTKEPNLEQLEVSAISLRAAILGYIEESDKVISEETYQIQST